MSAARKRINAPTSDPFFLDLAAEMESHKRRELLDIQLEEARNRAEDKAFRAKAAGPDARVRGTLETIIAALLVQCGMENEPPTSAAKELINSGTSAGVEIDVDHRTVSKHVAAAQARIPDGRKVKR